MKLPECLPEQCALPEGERLPSRLGAGGNGDCPFKGGFGVRKTARAGGVGAPRLSECLPQVNLPCLKLSLPDGGRRVRYGKLRSDLPRSLAAKDARPAKPELARPLAISSLPLAPPADKEAPFHPPGAPLP